MESQNSSGGPGPAPAADPGLGGFGAAFGNNGLAPAPSPFALVDMFIPGFSLTVSTVQRYLGIDLTLYLPLFLVYTGLTFVWQYMSGYFWDLAETHLMSVCELRPDDELYYQVLAWVAAQRFAQKSRRFIANSSLTGRWWWYWDEDSDDDDDSEDIIYDDDNAVMVNPDKKKPLSYTPSFGSHSFWFHGYLLRFTRVQNREQSGFLMASEKEEISISCFGRNPYILKELLLEARREHFKKDEQKTFIYRGTTRNGGDVSWQRCMSRTPRPFSTVILNEQVKKDLIVDMTDYLNPSTRRWYSNRGIPYRRGYLLYGPPGTGKSSLSLALAGYFKMRIYIVSLSSSSASEENLSNLFAELPRRCVVLLEDIDTAGLTHTREEDDSGDGDTNDDGDESSKDSRRSKLPKPSSNNNNSSRLSLSGLLNILDGVASQEGRILIMTTNHLEKLDKALIRPGRVDMTVKFGLADGAMAAAIFRAIFCPQDVDVVPKAKSTGQVNVESRIRLKGSKTSDDKAGDDKARDDKIKADNEAKADALAKIRNIEDLASQFAGKISHEEFSPAEIQGFLLKHKRDPEGAVAGVEEWMVKTRLDKSAKEKKDAEKAKKDAEKEKKEEAKALRKKKKEAEKKKRKKAKKRKEREEKRAKRKAELEAEGGAADGKTEDLSSSDSDSDSDSDSESESETSSTPTPAATPVVGKGDAEKKDNTSAGEGPTQVTVSVDQSDAGQQAGGTSQEPVDSHVDHITPLGFVEVKNDEPKRAGTDSGYGSPNVGTDDNTADVSADRAETPPTAVENGV